jgi:DNA-binding NarL/FixJ family response regulator
MMHILLAEQRSWLRSALRLLIELDTTMKVVGEAESLDELLCLTDELKPDLILLDWDMVRVDYPQTVLILRERHSEVLLIVLIGQNEEAERNQIHDAVAIVSKAEAPHQLLQALRQVWDSLATTRSSG